MSELKKTILCFLSICILTACSSTTSQNNSAADGKGNYSTIKSPPRKVIAILGSDRGWYEDEVKIHSDLMVSGLRIRVSSSKLNQEECISGQLKRIEISGPINKDTSYVIEKLLSEPKCKTSDGRNIVNTIYMNSNGGTLEDGYAIGRVFRKYGATTRVTFNQVCASACAVAYLGGKFRGMADDSSLIFHAPYIKTYDYGIERIKCADSKSAKPLLDYYKEMLDSNSATKLFERTMDFCSQSDGWTLDSGASKFFGIVNI